MLRLLDRMPFSAEPDEIVVRGERVRIRANQISVWVSMSLHRGREPDQEVSAFPAILDPGHTHSFALNERHLAEWAGFRTDAMTVRSAVRDRGQRISLY